MADGVGERRPLPAQERIDQQQMGDRLRRRGGDPEAAAQRQPAEVEREQQLEHQAEPEGGQRHARHRDDARPVVDPGVLVDGRQHAERDADHDGQQQRKRHQLEGIREVPRQVVADRVAAAQRLAEIAGGEASEIAHELDAERSVEAVPGADRLAPSTRLASGPAARRGGIAGDDVGDGERQAEQPEEHQAQEGQAPEQVLRQRRIVLTSPRWPAGRGRPRR